MKFLFFLIISAYSILPSFAHASVVQLTTDVPSVSLEGVIRIDVMLDSEEQRINAIEGVVVFNEDMFRLTDIQTGDTGVNFWVEEPKSRGTSGEIIFSGVTPGGISGSDVKIFSFILKSRSLGEDSLSLRNVDIFLNDGVGTKLSPRVQGLDVAVLSSGAPALQESVRDNDPPEDFFPYLGQNETIFNGKYFLAFSTQDKGSGIDRYEIKEGIWGRYSRAESPYPLKYQTLDRKIFIKAFDKQGNERFVVREPEHKLSRWEEVPVFGILILGIALSTIFFLWKKLLH